MKKEKSIGVNALLNGLKTILTVIFPLITFPYVSRILGVENVGKYNFALSFVNYMALVAALGVHTYAIRECSRCRNNQFLLNKTASEIFSINVLSTAVAYILLILISTFVPKFQNYRPIIYVLSISMALTTFGCDWIYPVFENYLFITIRTLVIYILSVVMLFTLVHDENDLLMYALVSVISSSGANIMNSIGRRRYCKISFTIRLNLKQHIKPIMMIFANTVTTTIYVNSDVLVLGLLTSDVYVGLYAVATKIYTIVKKLLAAVITVSIPRLSNYWSNGNREKFAESCNNIFCTLLILVAPAMVGLFSLSKEIILLISGPEYLEAVVSLRLLSIALLLSLFSWFFTSCILIPTKNEKKVLKATTVAAILNIILNFVLIPLYKNNAAAFTTCLAEAVSVCFGYYHARRILKIKIKVRDICTVVLGCFMIVVVCTFTVVNFSSNLLLAIVLSIVLAVISYGVILLAGRNSYMLNFCQIILGRLRRG